MGRFNLDDYEPVDDRLARFWTDHPDGAVSTNVVLPPPGSPEGTVAFLAAVYRNLDDSRPAGTGHASETPGGRGVNATSALENCETSAVGRALANAGYSPKGARPSREEMAAVQRQNDGVPSVDGLRGRIGALGEDIFGPLADWLASRDADKVADLDEDGRVALDVQLDAWEADR